MQASLVIGMACSVFWVAAALATVCHINQLLSPSHKCCHMVGATQSTRLVHMDAHFQLPAVGKITAVWQSCIFHKILYFTITLP